MCIARCKELESDLGCRLLHAATLECINSPLVLAIEIKNEALFNVHPNPTNADFKVVLKNPKDAFTLIVRSTLGKEIYNSSSETTVDISHLMNGIYYITVEQKGLSWTRKLVKK